MKRSKIFLYVIYLLFIGLSFVFIFFTNRMFDEWGIQKTLNFLKYWAMFGLGLFLLEILVENIALGRRKNKISRLEKENESLKAKIYDLEEKDRAVDQSIKAFEGSLKPKSEE